MIIRSSLLSLAADVIGLPVIGYQSIVTVSNIESSTAAVGFPAANLANAATHLKWKATDTGTQNIDVHPANALTNYVGIAGHNFGTATSTITIQGASDPNSPFDSPGLTDLVQATAITSDIPLIFQFVPQQMNTLRIQIASNDVIPEAAVVYVGSLLTLERGVKVDVDHSPINLGRKNSVINGYSESGHFLGRIQKNQTQESAAEFAHFTNSWYRASFDPFVSSAMNLPFFVAWAPNDYPTDTGYGWLTEDIVPLMNPKTRRFSANIKMRGIA